MEADTSRSLYISCVLDRLEHVEVTSSTGLCVHAKEACMIARA